MRRPDDEPACAHFESTCDGLAAEGAGGLVEEAARRALRAHAAECAECAGVLSTAAELRQGRAAFDVLEPGEAYWAQFPGRLDARLGGHLQEGRRYGRSRSGPALAALAVAAVLALIVGGLAVRRVLQAPAADRTVAEADLLEELDRAPDEQVAELLDEIAPPDIEAAAEELAEAGELLRDAGIPDADDGEDPYGPNLGLGGEDGDFMLEETRGEIG